MKLCHVDSNLKMYILLPLAVCFVTTYLNAEGKVLNARVVGGFDCHPRVVPYLVSLQTFHHQVYCGGSLLHAYWVLTAAHCCLLTPKEYIVYAGLEELTYGDHARAQQARVKRVIGHQDFSMLPWGSDLCLLELASPLKETEHVKHVRLATTSEYDQLSNEYRCNMSLAMGFGYRGVVYENGTSEPNPSSRILQCVFQRLMSDDYCKQGVALVDVDTTLCTHGNPVITADTCQGDSGGPLICQGYQIGIVAAGVGCGLGNQGYFTKVSPFFDFVTKYVPLQKSENKCNPCSKLSLVCLVHFTLFFHVTFVFRDVYLQ